MFLRSRRRSAERLRSAPLPWAALLVAAGGASLGAQTPDSLTRESGLRAFRPRVAGEWLQATGGPIGRHALPSLALTAGRHITSGALAGTDLELGWLRAARVTTTAQGVTGGLTRALRAGPLTLRPGVAVLAGQAIATADSGGYDWRGIAPPWLGRTGYQDRPRLTRGATVGAGLQLGADLAVARGLHLTGSVRQWAFSGDVIRANRSPLLAGVGLAFERAGRRNERTQQQPRPAARARATVPTLASTPADSAR